MCVLCYTYAFQTDMKFKYILLILQLWLNVISIILNKKHRSTESSWFLWFFSQQEICTDKDEKFKEEEEKCIMTNKKQDSIIAEKFTFSDVMKNVLKKRKRWKMKTEKWKR
jgi:hypothetical protein